MNNHSKAAAATGRPKGLHWQTKTKTPHSKKKQKEKDDLDDFLNFKKEVRIYHEDLKVHHHSIITELKRVNQRLKDDHRQTQKELIATQHSIATLQSAIVKTLTFIFSLLDLDQDSRAHAEAQIKDAYITGTFQSNHKSNE